jgi:hypothetical protein
MIFRLCSLVFLLLLAVVMLSERGVCQVSVIGELSQDREAAPGESYSGSIIVKNDTSEPQEAKVYQTDYCFTAEGTSTYGSAGTLPRSNARWVKFSPAVMVIPPQGSLNVNYTVTVPAGSPDLSGSFWSMLMVEGIPKGSPESGRKEPKQQPEMGLRQTLRYGIQVATHIPRGGVKNVRFLQSKLLAGEGQKHTLQVDIENSGTLWIRPDVSVELFNAKGISQGKLSGTKFRMYPGTSVRQAFDLGTLPAGSYKALVVVDAGGDDVFGAQFTFAI